MQIRAIFITEQKWEGEEDGKEIEKLIDKTP